MPWRNISVCLAREPGAKVFPVMKDNTFTEFVLDQLAALPELRVRSMFGAQGMYVLIGTPKQPTPAYTKVLFYVDGQTSQVLRVLILDGQQNRNRFDFSNAQVNTNVDAAKFTFNPPAGTTIVKP